MAKTLASEKAAPKRKPGLGRRNTMLLGFTGLILIMILGVFVGVLPTYNAYKASQEELTSAQERLDLATGAYRIAQSYEQDYPEVLAYAQELDARFPATAATPELNATITNAAISAGIPSSNISTISTSAPEPLTPAIEAPVADVEGGGASAGEAAPEGEEAAPAPAPAPVMNQEAVMTVSVSISGNAGQLTEFANNISESQRAFLVNSMSISVGEEGEATLEMSMTSYLHQTVPLPAPEVEQTEEENAEAPAE